MEKLSDLINNGSKQTEDINRVSSELTSIAFAIYWFNGKSICIDSDSKHWKHYQAYTLIQIIQIKKTILITILSLILMQNLKENPFARLAAYIEEIRFRRYW